MGYNLGCQLGKSNTQLVFCAEPTDCCFFPRRRSAARRSMCWSAPQASLTSQEQHQALAPAERRDRAAKWRAGLGAFGSARGSWLGGRGSR